MDNDVPHKESLKCVVVGDTAVGKTRLICARACNKKIALAQILNTHVPTVWAIDQYRIHREVLERSWEVVDTVHVSLRLWDTFGGHERDRRFAYGRSDVVLLCFSICNPKSLRNCRKIWYPEIRRFCPNTPIILVGCKNDMRFLYREDVYLNIFRKHSPFVKITTKSDLIMPDEAREMAHSLGVIYYETSVLTRYGISDVFENAIRLALIARRQQRFWMTNLKRVQQPHPQIPFRPPPPIKAPLLIAASEYMDHIHNMQQKRLHCDVILVAGLSTIPAHKLILAAFSKAFKMLFSSAAMSVPTRSNSDSSMVSSLGEHNDDSQHLLDVEQRINIRKRGVSCHTLLADCKETEPVEHIKEFKHPAFEFVKYDLQQEQMIVKLRGQLTATSVQQCIDFMYTGKLDKNRDDLEEIRKTAKCLEISELLHFISCESNLAEPNCNNDSHEVFLKQRIYDLCLKKFAFTDIVLELEDGVCHANKCLLAARCEVMQVMFKGDFREGQARTIQLPGVREYSFDILLHYLYTDDIPPVIAIQCPNLLDLANRFCLPRLVNLIEVRVVDNLEKMSPNQTIEACLGIMEPSKLYNGHQLADWCMKHLCMNFNKLCKMSPRNLRLLNAENQAYLVENRWPPVWYLKEFDYYQRCLSKTRVIQSSPTASTSSSSSSSTSSASRANSDTDSNSGCLCFSTKRSESDRDLSVQIAAGTRNQS